MKLVARVTKWVLALLVLLAASTLIYDRIPQMCILAPVDRVIGLRDFLGRVIIESNGQVVLAEDNPVEGQNGLHSCVPIWSYYETVYTVSDPARLHY